MPKHWDVLNLPMAAFAAQVGSPFLNWEQRGRLAVAIPRLWAAGLGNGATPNEWRKALGYSREEWTDNEGAFLEALESDLGSELLHLPFMREEVERQARVSAQQSGRAGKRWHAAASPGTPTVLPPIGPGIPLQSNGSAVESLGVGVGSGVGASQKQKTPRRSPDDRDWAAAFEDHWWPLYRSFRPDGKAEARREWDRIQARGQEAFDVIYHALELEAARWKADRTEAQYIPHARTWLHQKRYLDHGELPLSSTSEPTTIADSLHATDLPGTTL